jgi:hypothetical protein
MARELFATIEGRPSEAASSLIATGKQLANGFLYDEGTDDPVSVHSLKIDWLRELVESLDGEPLLIAYEAYRLPLGDAGEWFPATAQRLQAADRKRLAKADRRRSRSAVMDRSALASTGMKIDGDLAAIDVDVADAGLIDALADELGKRFPMLFEHGLVRHAGGTKEAWIVRVDEPLRRLASRRWYRGSDPDDPAVSKHLVECFGSLGTRQFAVDGPHERNGANEVISVYSFTGNASPATPPRTSLPALPKAAFSLACNLFDEVAAAAGLTAIARSG